MKFISIIMFYFQVKKQHKQVSPSENLVNKYDTIYTKNLINEVQLTTPSTSASGQFKKVVYERGICKQ